MRFFIRIYLFPSDGFCIFLYLKILGFLIRDRIFVKHISHQALSPFLNTTPSPTLPTQVGCVPSLSYSTLKTFEFRLAVSHVRRKIASTITSSIVSFATPTLSLDTVCSIHTPNLLTY